MTTATVGSVISLWRYPVKSMLGEELNATDITEKGVVGDRAYALIESETGKVVSAKNPRRWSNMFSFQAAFTATPTIGEPLPQVQITLPDGTQTRSDATYVNQILSEALGREVILESNAPVKPVLEEYWLDLEGQPYREAVTDEATLSQTFFDLATIHLLTTATIAQLQELTPTGRFEVKRFRPNIIVTPTSNNEGFVENDWIGHTLAIGDEVRLSITGPCPRCVMITLPQEDLPRDPAILKTALQHNQGDVGIYARVVQGGTIRQGDVVRLE